MDTTLIDVPDKRRTFAEVGVPFMIDGATMYKGNEHLRIAVPVGIAKRVATALPFDRRNIEVLDTPMPADFKPDLVADGTDIRFTNGFIAPEALVTIASPSATSADGVSSSRADELVTRVTDLVKSHALSRLSPDLNDYGVFEGIKQVGFFRGSRQVQPQEIFSAYDNLDFLVNLNKNQPSRFASMGDIASLRAQSRTDEMGAILDEFRASLPQDIVAVAKTSDGRLTAFEVRYRTNFFDRMTKKPNIVYLVQEPHVVVMRVGKTYDENVVGPQIRQYGNKINKTYYQAMLTGTHAKAQLDFRKLLFLPEPYLLAALEKMYREGAPRVTPLLKVVEMTDKDVFYVRTWLKSLRDLPLNPKAVAKYVGAAHAYGLLEESWERQVIHYCEQPNGQDVMMVNIDPDLMLSSMRQGYLTRDIRDFVKKIRENHPMSDKEVTAFKKEVTAERLKYEPLNLSTRLVENIPPDLLGSVLKDLAIPRYNPAKNQSLSF